MDCGMLIAKYGIVEPWHCHGWSIEPNEILKISVQRLDKFKAVAVPLFYERFEANAGFVFRELPPFLKVFLPKSLTNFLFGS